MGFIFILLLSFPANASNTVILDKFQEAHVCEPLYNIDFEAAKGKPSDPAYIPLFQEAQARYDEFYETPEDRSVEYLCNIIYDCGNVFRLDNGEIEFKDCSPEEESND